MGRIWFVSSQKLPFISQLCHLIGWLIDWSGDWLIDWLIAWLSDWLIDWLIDWAIDWLSFPIKLVAWAGAWLFDWAQLLQSFWRTFINVRYFSVYRDGNTWEPETNVMHLEIVHEFLAARRASQMSSRDYAVSANSHSRKDRRYSPFRPPSRPFSRPPSRLPSRPPSPRYSYIREDRVIRKDKSRRRHSIKETVTSINRIRKLESVDWLALRLIGCSNDSLLGVSIDWFFKRLIEWLSDLFDWVFDWLIDWLSEWVSDQLIDWLIGWWCLCMFFISSPNFFLFFLVLFEAQRRREFPTCVWW